MGWKPRLIPNPDYYHDAEPYKMTTIGGIGIELWTMSDAIYFDNILITDSMGLADLMARETFDLKMSVIDATSGNIFKRIIDYSNKNPWLYAVYVVLVGLPTVIITFCCTGASKTDDDKSSLNDPKKTDAEQEDDEPEDEQGEDVNEEGDGNEEESEEE